MHGFEIVTGLSKYDVHKTERCFILEHTYGFPNSDRMTRMAKEGQIPKTCTHQVVEATFHPLEKLYELVTKDRCSTKVSQSKSAVSSVAE